MKPRYCPNCKALLDEDEIKGAKIEICDECGFTRMFEESDSDPKGAEK